MAEGPNEPLEDDEGAPEPAETSIPPGWAPPPAAVETTVEAGPGIEVKEEEDLRRERFSRKRRFWTTTVVFILVWFALARFAEISGNPLWLLVPLVPIYLVTLATVLRRPKKRKPKRAKFEDRLDTQYKIMITVAVFLAFYVPFTFFSNQVIPYAPLVEYVLFAFLLFLLLRLAGRAVGVAPSPDALPPPSHRLHQQVIAPIDDAHYQQGLWLNYHFVEQGRGSRALSKRIDQILEENGITQTRRSEILNPLEAYPEHGGWWLTRRGRERRSAGRDERARILDELFTTINRELEQAA